MFVSAETLESIAAHHYGNTNDLVIFSKIALRGFGMIDCVLARHAPMQPTIVDFVLVCSKSDKNYPAKRLQLAAICKLWGIKGYMALNEREYHELVSEDIGPFPGDENNLPDQEAFVQRLNTRLRRTMLSRVRMNLCRSN